MAETFDDFFGGVFEQGWHHPDSIKISRCEGFVAVYDGGTTDVEAQRQAASSNAITSMVFIVINQSMCPFRNIRFGACVKRSERVGA